MRPVASACLESEDSRTSAFATNYGLCLSRQGSPSGGRMEGFPAFLKAKTPALRREERSSVVFSGTRLMLPQCQHSCKTSCNSRKSMCSSMENSSLAARSSSQVKARGI